MGAARAGEKGRSGEVGRAPSLAVKLRAVASSRRSQKAGRTAGRRLINIDSSMRYPPLHMTLRPHQLGPPRRAGASEASRSRNLSGRLDSLTSPRSSPVS